ncbi:MAG: cyclic nucleotide-binding domain-containing protein [Magnetococcales bacterium]|nr:cyclic nucleotide-binding domain-containing protein [Magnetococcales bacterium]
MKSQVTDTELVTFLKGVDGFKDVQEDYLERMIIPLVGINAFHANQVIIKRGMEGANLHILYQGRMRVIVPKADGTVFEVTLGPGAIVGEMSLVSNQPTMADVVAEGPCLVLTLDGESLTNLILEDWRVTRAFARLIGQRVVARSGPHTATL